MLGFPNRVNFLILKDKYKYLPIETSTNILFEITTKLIYLFILSIDYNIKMIKNNNTYLQSKSK